MTLERHRRQLSHWSQEGSFYFVTFRLKASALNPTEVAFVRDYILECPNAFILAIVVMSDHVHLILRPHDSETLSTVMKGIKGSSARRLNLRRRTIGTVWQHESFDRIIRSEDELREKLNYMLMNPVRAGIANDPWKYAGWYLNEKSSQ